MLGSDNVAAYWLFNRYTLTQALKLGQARSPSWRVGWFVAAVVPGRPWPDASKQARTGKSDDYLLRRADRMEGGPCIPSSRALQ